MAETPSSMLPLGTKAPDFRLMDTQSGQFISLPECQSTVATVIMFLSNHCPYVKHIQSKLVEITKIYQAQNVSFIAISANDIVQYPEDGPEKMRLEAETHHYDFPYLYDETQTVAKLYQAACTPDFYIFDKDLLCVYRGCFDESTPKNNKPVTGCHLTHALDCLIQNKPIDAAQKPSLGCNIKWKPREQ